MATVGGPDTWNFPEGAVRDLGLPLFSGESLRTLRACKIFPRASLGFERGSPASELQVFPLLPNVLPRLACCPREKVCGPLLLPTAPEVGLGRCACLLRPAGECAVLGERNRQSGLCSAAFTAPGCPPCPLPAGAPLGGRGAARLPESLGLALRGAGWADLPPAASVPAPLPTRPGAAASPAPLGPDFHLAACC